MTAAAALVSTLQLLLLMIAVVAGHQLGLTPNCRTNCGGVRVPYPFGIGPGCYLAGFNLICDESSTPPRLLLPDDRTFQVVFIDIKNAVLRIQRTTIRSSSRFGEFETKVPGHSSPYRIAWLNELILTGCNVLAKLSADAQVFVNRTVSGCASFCYTKDMADDLEDYFSHKKTMLGGKKCFGVGCCQERIPIPAKSYTAELEALDGGRELDGVVPVSGLIAEEGWFDREITSLKMFRRHLANASSVPLVLHWYINSGLLATGEESAGNATCPRDLGSNSCHSQHSRCTSINNNSTYSNQTVGYFCQCDHGYRGNPFLPQGCQDIDECSHPDKCYGICTNKPGTYVCHCPRGTRGDAYAPHGCVPLHHPGLSIGIGVGSGAAVLILALGTAFLVRKGKARRNKKLRQLFFSQNRGQLLQQLVCHRTDIAERMIITLEELEKATNNFDEARELGHGGHGTVYKGILSSLHVVAIKKSKIVIQREIDKFINEIAILSQMNHKHIVKILGCCLETEVPLLVYEFIANGSLYNHLHIEAAISLSWKDRLRIAVETARATAYLHSFVSVPIIHRDIKSQNILLDDNLSTKLSDFGASRYIPVDQTGLDTTVQGTFGYLDPMYYSTGHLTAKSDVYSFGVLLIELLTRKKPVSYRSPEGYGLVKHFVTLLSERNLDDILDVQVLNEGCGEVTDVALLAAMCVKYVDQDRPTMKQIEIVLESIHAAKEQVSSDISDDDESENWVVANNDPSVEQVPSHISDDDDSENWVLANNIQFVEQVSSHISDDDESENRVVANNDPSVVVVADAS